MERQPRISHGRHHVRLRAHHHQERTRSAGNGSRDHNPLRSPDESCLHSVGDEPVAPLGALGAILSRSIRLSGTNSQTGGESRSIGRTEPLEAVSMSSKTHNVVKRETIRVRRSSDRLVTIARKAERRAILTFGNRK
jgi:hypothetical protein